MSDLENNGLSGTDNEELLSSTDGTGGLENNESEAISEQSVSDNETEGFSEEVEEVQEESTDSTENFEESEENFDGDEENGEEAGEDEEPNSSGDTDEQLDGGDTIGVFNSSNSSDDMGNIKSNHRAGGLFGKRIKTEKKQRSNVKTYCKAILSILVCAILIVSVVFTGIGISKYSKMSGSVKDFISTYNNQKYSYTALTDEQKVFNDDMSLTEVGKQLFGGDDYRTLSIKNINGDSMYIENYISFGEYYNQRLKEDQEGILEIFEQLPKDSKDKSFTPNSDLVSGAFEMLSVGSAEYIQLIAYEYMAMIDTMEYLRASVGAMDSYLDGLNKVYSDTASQIDMSDQDQFIVDMSDWINSVVTDKELKESLMAESKKIDNAVVLNVAFNKMMQNGEATVKGSNGEKKDTKTDELNITDLEYCFSLDQVGYNGTIEARCYNTTTETEAAYKKMAESATELSNYLNLFGVYNWKMFSDDTKSKMSSKLMNKQLAKVQRADKLKFDNIMTNKIFKRDLEGAGLTSVLLGGTMLQTADEDTLALSEQRLGLVLELKVKDLKMSTSLEKGFEKFYDYANGAVGFLTTLDSAGTEYFNSIASTDGTVDQTKIDKANIEYKKAMLYYAIYNSLMSRSSSTLVY